MKVLTVGYFGQGNVGDDLLLDRFASICRTVDIEPIATWGSLSPWAAATETTAPDLAHVAKVLPNCDAVVLGPGGILNNARAPLGRHRYTSLAYVSGVVDLAHRHGKPVAAVGVGIGPLVGRHANDVTHSILGSCSTVTVRDPDALGRVPTHIDAATVDDLAFTGPRAVHPAPESGTLALNVRSWGSRRATNGRSRSLRASLIHAAAEGSLERIVGVPMSVNPHPNLDDRVPLQRLLGDLSTSVDVDLDTAVSPESVGHTIAGASHILAMRLHAGILGLIAGRPVGMIGYDPKVRAILEPLGVGVIDDAAPSTTLVSELLQTGTVGDLPGGSIAPIEHQLASLSTASGDPGHRTRLRPRRLLLALGL